MHIEENSNNNFNNYLNPYLQSQHQQNNFQQSQLQQQQSVKSPYIMSDCNFSDELSQSSPYEYSTDHSTASCSPTLYQNSPLFSKSHRNSLNLSSKSPFLVKQSQSDNQDECWEEEVLEEEEDLHKKQKNQDKMQKQNNNNTSSSLNSIEQYYHINEQQQKQSYQNSNLYNNTSNYQDRFIPNRKTSKINIAFSNNFSDSQNLLPWAYSANMKENQMNKYKGSDEGSITVSDIYKLHVLGLNLPPKKSELFPFQNNNILQYKNQRILNSTLFGENNYNQNNDIFNQKKYFFELDENIDTHFFKNTRKIQKVPYKVLDAPALQDDFYLNLIDWSAQNTLAVGLSSSVYLWSADSSRVTKLCDLGISDIVTSVQYNQQGNLLCLGTNSGESQIWDVEKVKKIRTMTGHSARVGCVAWNSNTLSTGSRDKSILNRDIRSPNNFYQKFTSHKQEVCGLKWSFDEQQLASGGNDNKLYVWNRSSPNPVSNFNQHTAAIKALAWSPHQHGLLVSGGGTADRTMRFWNTLQNEQVNVIDTGSQVCNLMFSKNVNELVSTHGYSQNQVIVWNYPDMEKLATLTGHTYRVLYLAMSPCGQTIVTGAGDETLRFWNVFPPKNGKTIKSDLQPTNNNQMNLSNFEKSSLLPQNNSLR